MSKMQITVEPNASEADVSAVVDGLRTYNIGIIGDPREQKVQIFLRDDADAVVGGLLGHIRWRWLYVSKLWIDATLRGEGHGARILERAEDLARTAGCIGSYLDTFEYQARPFYEKNGYALFGTLDGYPPGYCQFYLSKRFD